jgi:hypothetical protein
MEVSGQLHVPAALLPGKELLVPVGEEKNLQRRESNPRTLIVQPVAWSLY